MVGSPVFEFDEAKSQSNDIKHGIDFVEAQALWQDENMLEVSVRVVGGASVRCGWDDREEILDRGDYL